MKPSAQPLPLATHTLPWFAMLALVVGAAPFAVDASSITAPRLALTALIMLAVESVITRLLPVLRRQLGLRVMLDILIMLLFAVLICVASGGLDSHLLTLFLLPLTAAAIVLSRLGFMLTALLTVGSFLLLGELTPDIDTFSAPAVIRMIGNLAPVLIATGAISLLIGHMQNAERQIRDLSSHDALTGLLNLRSFETVMSGVHQKAGRSGRGFSVLVIDLDNLTQIKEAHGHEAANQALIAVADAIRRSTRSVDAAARLGGDELAVMLVDADPTAAETVAQRIRNHVYAGTISVGNRLVRANVSIGLAHFPMDGLLPKELLEHALLAMQKDRSKRKPEQTFTPAR